MTYWREIGQDLNFVVMLRPLAWGSLSFPSPGAEGGSGAGKRPPLGFRSFTRCVSSCSLCRLHENKPSRHTRQCGPGVSRPLSGF